MSGKWWYGLWCLFILTSPVLLEIIIFVIIAWAKTRHVANQNLWQYLGLKKQSWE